MKILQIAPLWEDIPPKAYGGTELVVHILCEELLKRGHEVTLLASQSSNTSANLISITQASLRETKNLIPNFYENISATKAIELSEQYDLIHNHCGLTMLPFQKLLKAPMITTLHGAFVVQDEIDAFKLYKHLPFISISNSQRGGYASLNYISTVYNGINTIDYKFNANPDSDDPYLCFLGRISPEKGPDLAIKLAKETGWKLKMAAKVDKKDEEYFEKDILPLVDNEKIVFLGEVGLKDKVELLRNAYANIHTVTWPEPFGLTMAESMACGTPVLALNQGSIPEVVKHGVTGYVEENIDDLIKRVDDIDKISRHECRKRVEENFSGTKMVDDYVKAYYKLVASSKIKVKYKPF